MSLKEMGRAVTESLEVMGQERSGVGPGASRMAAKNHKPAGGRTMNMNMYVYRVAEKQDFGSPGEPGEPFRSLQLERGEAHLNPAAES